MSHKTVLSGVTITNQWYQQQPPTSTDKIMERTYIARHKTYPDVF